ncbi:MAG: hypothetical protein ACI4NV_08240 [Thermoguttaceae bacterium]
MDALTQIMKISQTLEKRLETRYGATGNGLTQRIRSIEDKIPNHICQKIKQIAYVRNQAAHEDVSIAEKNLAFVKDNFDYTMNALNYTDSVLAKIGDALAQIIDVNKKLCALLEKRYGASGNGLHQKLNSVKSKVPFRVQGKIHKIATIYTKAAHKDYAVALRSLKDVLKLDDEISTILNREDASQNKKKGLTNRGNKSRREKFGLLASSAKQKRNSSNFDSSYGTSTTRFNQTQAPQVHGAIQSDDRRSTASPSGRNRRRGDNSLNQLKGGTFSLKPLLVSGGVCLIAILLIALLVICLQ